MAYSQTMTYLWSVVKKHISILGVAALVLVSAPVVFAQHHGDDHDRHGGRNWQLTIGVGGGMMTKYDGADEYEFIPIPFLDAAYHLDAFNAFVNEDKGLGMGVNFGRFSIVPLTLSAGINLGEGRKPDDAALLKGTPKVKNEYRLVGSAELELPLGEISAEVNYFPTTLDYKDRADVDYNGLLAEIEWEGGLSLSRNILMQVGLGAGWMNDDYADSFYSVHSPTQKLKAYNAGSGLHDVHASVQGIYMFTMNVGAAVFSEMTYLLGDSADSPMTKSEFQPFVGGALFYNF